MQLHKPGKKDFPGHTGHRKFEGNKRGPVTGRLAVMPPNPGKSKKVMSAEGSVGFLEYTLLMCKSL